MVIQSVVGALPLATSATTTKTPVTTQRKGGMVGSGAGVRKQTTTTMAAAAVGAATSKDSTSWAFERPSSSTTTTKSASAHEATATKNTSATTATPKAKSKKLSGATVATATSKTKGATTTTDNSAAASTVTTSRTSTAAGVHTTTKKKKKVVKKVKTAGDTSHSHTGHWNFERPSSTPPTLPSTISSSAAPPTKDDSHHPHRSNNDNDDDDPNHSYSSPRLTKLKATKSSDDVILLTPSQREDDHDDDDNNDRFTSTTCPPLIMNQKKVQSLSERGYRTTGTSLYGSKQTQLSKTTTATTTTIKTPKTPKQQKQPQYSVKEKIGSLQSISERGTRTTLASTDDDHDQKEEDTPKTPLSHDNKSISERSARTTGGSGAGSSSSAAGAMEKARLIDKARYLPTWEEQATIMAAHRRSAKNSPYHSSSGHAAAAATTTASGSKEPPIVVGKLKDRLKQFEKAAAAAVGGGINEANPTSSSSQLPPIPSWAQRRANFSATVAAAAMDAPKTPTGAPGPPSNYSKHLSSLSPVLHASYSNFERAQLPLLNPFDEKGYSSSTNLLQHEQPWSPKGGRQNPQQQSRDDPLRLSPDTTEKPRATPTLQDLSAAGIVLENDDDDDDDNDANEEIPKRAMRVPRPNKSSFEAHRAAEAAAVSAIDAPKVASMPKQNESSKPAGLSKSLHHKPHKGAKVAGPASSLDGEEGGAHEAIVPPTIYASKDAPQKGGGIINAALRALNKATGLGEEENQKLQPTDTLPAPQQVEQLPSQQQNQRSKKEENVVAPSREGHSLARVLPRKGNTLQNTEDEGGTGRSKQGAKAAGRFAPPWKTPTSTRKTLATSGADGGGGTAGQSAVPPPPLPLDSPSKSSSGNQLQESLHSVEASRGTRRGLHPPIEDSQGKTFLPPWKVPKSEKTEGGSYRMQRRSSLPSTQSLHSASWHGAVQSSQPLHVEHGPKAVFRRRTTTDATFMSAQQELATNDAANKSQPSSATLEGSSTHSLNSRESTSRRSSRSSSNRRGSLPTITASPVNEKRVLPLKGEILPHPDDGSMLDMLPEGSLRSADSSSYSQSHSKPPRRLSMPSIGASSRQNFADSSSTHPTSKKPPRRISGLPASTAFSEKTSEHGSPRVAPKRKSVPPIDSRKAAGKAIEGTISVKASKLAVGKAIEGVVQTAATQSAVVMHKAKIRGAQKQSGDQDTSDGKRSTTTVIERAISVNADKLAVGKAFEGAASTKTLQGAANNAKQDGEALPRLKGVDDITKNLEAHVDKYPPVRRKAKAGSSRSVGPAKRKKKPIEIPIVDLDDSLKALDLPPPPSSAAIDRDEAGEPVRSPLGTMMGLRDLDIFTPKRWKKILSINPIGGHVARSEGVDLEADNDASEDRTNPLGVQVLSSKNRMGQDTDRVNVASSEQPSPKTSGKTLKSAGRRDARLTEASNDRKKRPKSVPPGKGRRIRSDSEADQAGEDALSVGGPSSRKVRKPRPSSPLGKDGESVKVRKVKKKKKKMEDAEEYFLQRNVSEDIREPSTRSARTAPVSDSKGDDDEHPITPAGSETLKKVRIKKKRIVRRVEKGDGDENTPKKVIRRIIKVEDIDDGNDKRTVRRVTPEELAELRKNGKTTTKIIRKKKKKSAVATEDSGDALSACASTKVQAPRSRVGKNSPTARSPEGLKSSKILEGINSLNRRSAHSRTQDDWEKPRRLRPVSNQLGVKTVPKLNDEAVNVERSAAGYDRAKAYQLQAVTDAMPGEEKPILAIKAVSKLISERSKGHAPAALPGMPYLSPEAFSKSSVRASTYSGVGDSQMPKFDKLFTPDLSQPDREKSVPREIAGAGTNLNVPTRLTKPWPPPKASEENALNKPWKVENDSGRQQGCEAIEATGIPLDSRPVDTVSMADAKPPSQDQPAPGGAAAEQSIDEEKKSKLHVQLLEDSKPAQVPGSPQLSSPQILTPPSSPLEDLAAAGRRTTFDANKLKTPESSAKKHVLSSMDVRASPKIGVSPSLKDRLKLFEAPKQEAGAGAASKNQALAIQKSMSFKRRKQEIICATKIQAMARGKLNRCVYRRHKAAIRIQAFARAVPCVRLYRIATIKHENVLIQQAKRNEQLLEWSQMEAARKDELEKIQKHLAEDNPDQLVQKIKRENNELKDTNHKLSEMNSEIKLSNHSIKKPMAVDNVGSDAFRSKIAIDPEKQAVESIAKEGMPDESRSCTDLGQSAVLAAEEIVDAVFEIAVATAEINVLTEKIVAMSSHQTNPSNPETTPVEAIKKEEKCVDMEYTDYDETTEHEEIEMVSEEENSLKSLTESTKPRPKLTDEDEEAGFELSFHIGEDDDVSDIGMSVGGSGADWMHESHAEASFIEIEVLDDDDEYIEYEEEVVEDDEDHDDDEEEDEDDDDFSCESSVYIENTSIIL